MARKRVSAADANRDFSRMLRGVREEGATYVITSHGTPVAQLAAAPPLLAEQVRSRERLLRRLRQQAASGERGWTRDELYDRSR